MCATESKEGLSAENRNQNRKSIVSEPTRLQKPASPAQCPLPNYPVHLISFTFSSILSAMWPATRPHTQYQMQTQATQPLPRYIQYTVRLNGPPHLAHSGLRSSSSLTYFRQPPNLPTAARRNRKCAECDTAAFGRNRKSAKSAHLSTFGAETETEAEIRSTSSLFWYMLSTLSWYGCVYIYSLCTTFTCALLSDDVVTM